jgi:hypothetical protein
MTTTLAPAKRSSPASHNPTAPAPTTTTSIIADCSPGRDRGIQPEHERCLNRLNVREPAASASRGVYANSPPKGLRASSSAPSGASPINRDGCKQVSSPTTPRQDALLDSTHARVITDKGDKRLKPLTTHYRFHREQKTWPSRSRPARLVGWNDCSALVRARRRCCFNATGSSCRRQPPLRPPGASRSHCPS